MATKGFFLGPKISEKLPEPMKKPESFNSFKKEIKKWKPDDCSRRPYKKYIYIYIKC